MQFRVTAKADIDSGVNVGPGQAHLQPSGRNRSRTRLHSKPTARGLIVPPLITNKRRTVQFVVLDHELWSIQTRRVELKPMLIVATHEQQDEGWNIERSSDRPD